MLSNHAPKAQGTGYEFPTPQAFSTLPRFQMWQAVEVLAITETSPDNAPEYYWHPAYISGAHWEPRFQAWHYTLFYPTAPASWLPDCWFDSCATPEEELRAA